MKQQKEKIAAGIFGVAVGDALGVPVEFRSRESLAKDPVKDLREYGTHRQPKGTWSDDSSLLFCLLESLVEGYDPEDVATRFLQWKNEGYWTPHGSVFDIGMTTRFAIDEVAKGTPAHLCGGMDEWSNGNGSLMRILPMAYFLFAIPDRLERYEKVKVISSITHGHIRSVLACFIYVEYAIRLLKGKDKLDALLAMQDELKPFFTKLEINPDEVALFKRVLNGNIGEVDQELISGSGYVLDSLEASLWALLSTHSFEEAVLKAVNLGEDTDTTGAITGGLAGLYYGFNNQFDFWRFQLARFEDVEYLIEKFTTTLNAN